MIRGFAKGLFIGSIVGATIGMMVEPGVMDGRSRKRMMRAGRNLMRRSGSMIGNVVEMFR